MKQPSAYIGRQPDLNRNQQIIGYQILFRPAKHQQDHGTEDAERHIGSHIIVNTLSNMDASALIGNKYAFIKVGPSLLMSDFLDLLNPQRVILELSSTLDSDPAIIKRTEQLRRHGFGLALDDYRPADKRHGLLHIANYVKLSLQRLGREPLDELSQELRHFPLIQIAEQVESQQDFAYCHEIGMDGFQGRYFARPETLSAQTLHPQLGNIIQLLNKLRSNAEPTEIELGFKQDVAMSYKLFRYINSAGFALVNEITNFRQAVTLLGYQKLYRWLTLLLVTASEDVGVPPALLKTAVTRARFMELLARQVGRRLEPDNAFVTGMFSLLDVLLDMPMTNALDNLLLPDDIRTALLDRTGVLGVMLRLVESCEDPQLADTGLLSHALELSPDILNAAHVSALSWVEELRI